MLDFLKEGDIVEYKMIPNKLVATDSKGFRWYRKGLNNNKDKWFFSGALLEGGGRAHSKVKTSHLEIVKEHDRSGHLEKLRSKQCKYFELFILIAKIKTKQGRAIVKLKDKEIDKTGKKIKRDLYVSCSRMKELETSLEASISEGILGGKPYKFYSNCQSSIFEINKSCPKSTKTHNFPIAPNITNARIIKRMQNNDIFDGKKEIFLIKQKLAKICKNEVVLHSNLMKFLGNGSTNELKKDHQVIFNKLNEDTPIQFNNKLDMIRKSLDKTDNRLNDFNSYNRGFKPDYNQHLDQNTEDDTNDVSRFMKFGEPLTSELINDTTKTYKIDKDDAS